MIPFNIFSEIEKNLQDKPKITTKRIPTFTPSSSMCYSALDSKPLGSCIRSEYLRRQKVSPSNPMGIYVKMTTEAGKLWESWIINQYKELGIYLDHSVKVADPIEFVSGEIDILHLNPLTKGIEISEIKQYNGSNYYALQELKGTPQKLPKPKDQNLLQVFEYLLVLKDEIQFLNLIYIDRSCASYYNNIQFIIELTNINNLTYPKIYYYDHNNEIQSYVDFRINDKVIKEKREMLKQFLDLDQIPPKDYTLKYSERDIKIKVSTGEISKTKYNQYLKDPSNVILGDYLCRYCAYGPDKDGFSVCESLD